MPNAPTDRCFVAVWPDDRTANELDSLAARLHREHPGTRRVQRANLHLTLAFIGPLQDTLQDAVADELAAIDVTAFDWCIDHFGTFAGARVLWAASASNHPALNALAGRVRSLLDTLEIRYDHQPFTAHVTLLRHLPRAGIAGIAGPLERPIRWTVRRAVLLRSLSTATGVRYVERKPAD